MCVCVCVCVCRWLNDWEKNRTKEVKATKKGGGAWGWANQGDGAGFRAALLSGPPGVGKTTTAILACEVGHVTTAFQSCDSCELST